MKLSNVNREPLLSIIIVALNEEKRVPRLLKNILNEIVCNDNEVEVILIDNRSADRTFDLMKTFMFRCPAARLFKDLGILGEVYDRAIKYYARGRYVILIDTDMLFPGHWISSVKQIIEKYPECDAVIARILPTFRFIGSFNTAVLAYLLGALHDKDSNLWRERTFHSGGLIVKRDIACKISFRSLPTSEDGDFSYRFLVKGFKACYFPEKYVVFDEQFYDIKTAISYYKKLGISIVVLLREERSLRILTVFIRTLLEPLTPHYLVVRRKVAQRHGINVKITTWLLLGLSRILSMYYSILLYGILGLSIKKKVTRLKY